mmetsp:Transcript_63669/g.151841  ORF Transcript_63669/g.151841 Transcript_63669/m.151841 type:complete len:292 (-) Transcript_63669:141-1016(-)
MAMQGAVVVDAAQVLQPHTEIQIVATVSPASLRSVAGPALAGSVCVGIFTPLRNALTASAKDLSSSYLGLYRSVFSKGLVGGFRGGAWPTAAALPQFAAIGPVYHVTKNATSSVAVATFTASFAESLFTYAAQSRNAQMAYNATRSSAEHIPVTSLSWPFGPGFSFNVTRNCFAMMGIRIFAPWCSEAIEKLPVKIESEEAKAVMADISASTASAALSMPFNHAFSWAACTPELQSMSIPQRMQAAGRFLFETYSQQGVRLLGRDLAVRWSYTACVYTLYHALERRVLADH